MTVHPAGMNHRCPSLKARFIPNPGPISGPDLGPIQALFSVLQEDLRRELAKSSFGNAMQPRAPHGPKRPRAGGRAQEVLDSVSGGDAALLVGGDLTVLVSQVRT